MLNFKSINSGNIKTDLICMSRIENGFTTIHLIEMPIRTKVLCDFYLGFFLFQIVVFNIHLTFLLMLFKFYTNSFQFTWMIDNDGSFVDLLWETIYEYDKLSKYKRSRKTFSGRNCLNRIFKSCFVRELKSGHDLKNDICRVVQVFHKSRSTASVDRTTEHLISTCGNLRQSWSRAVEKPWLRKWYKVLSSSS